jgi:hypothetical protein
MKSRQILFRIFSFQAIIQAFFYIPFYYSLPCWADWDLSSMNAISSDCGRPDSKVDETKLSLSFADFSIHSNNSFNSSLPFGVFNKICSLSLNYKVAAGQKVKTLTQRLFARIEKERNTDIKVSSAVMLAGETLPLIGRMHRGTIFNGRALLYKSYDLSHIFHCAAEEQEVAVKFEWALQIELVEDTHGASLVAEREPHGLDYWLETESCLPSLQEGHAAMARAGK